MWDDQTSSGNKIGTYKTTTYIEVNISISIEDT